MKSPDPVAFFLAIGALVCGVLAYLIMNKVFFEKYPGRFQTERKYFTICLILGILAAALVLLLDYLR